VCAVRRRRFPVGASPTRQPLQPEATGAVMEVTKWLKLFTGAGWGVVSVPASAAVEAAAANQKHDHDNDEKSGHIHDDVSFGQTSGRSL